MKVKISYIEPKEIIMGMSPELYCKLRANLSTLFPFPPNARDCDIEIVDEESEKELDDYFFEKGVNNENFGI